MDGSRRRILTSKALCGAVASLALALAACSNSSVHGKSSASPAAPTPTATVSLATAHADWTALASTPPGAANFTFAPSNPQVGYLCTRVDTNISQAQPKLYKTSDSGQHWNEVSGLPAIQVPSDLGLSPQLSCNTFVDAADSNDVFLQQLVIDPRGADHAAARALYRSHDGGASWGLALGTLDHTDGFDQLAVVGSRLIAQAHPSVFGGSGCNPSDPAPKASSVIYASDDGGRTWHDAGQSLEVQGYSPISFAVVGSTAFAIADNVPATACAFITSSLWRSDDGGTTWQIAYTPSPSSWLRRLGFARRAGGTGYVGAALASTRVVYSGDNGANWVLLPDITALHGNSNPTDPITWGALAVAPSGAVIAQVEQGAMPGGTRAIYAIRPNSPAPTWQPYAAGDGYPFQLSASVVGDTFWVLDVDRNTSVLKYLPLP